MDLRKFSFAAFLLSFLLIFNFSAFAQTQAELEAAKTAALTPEQKKGQKIFKSNCATCHKVKSKLTGPALMDAEKRWNDNGAFNGISGKDWMHKWIRNSPEVLASGHPYANKLFQEYNKTAMTPFTTLTDEDIANVLGYIDFEAKYQPPVIGPPPATGPNYTVYILYALVAILFLVVIALGSFLGKLGVKALEKQGLPVPAPVPFYKEKKLIVTVALVALIFVGYAAVNNAIDLGRQQGYSPEQPIKYSHELHAGINQINCQYCHTGAPKGKQANIPSMNICMNCHKGIKGDEPTANTKYGKKEISKIYASIGFNPAEGKYIENYAQMDKAAADKLFTDWLTSGDAKVKPTEADVKEVLQYVQKPIEWVRIHNLPDHVYFNHSQHFTVGNIECQTCHGPIEKMEKVYQFAPLSMGWCVNCHRSTEVNFSGNKFYEDYHQLHEDLKNGTRSKITVETIGGTECQKCHY